MEILKFVTLLPARHTHPWQLILRIQLLTGLLNGVRKFRPSTPQGVGVVNFLLAHKHFKKLHNIIFNLNPTLSTGLILPRNKAPGPGYNQDYFQSITPKDVGDAIFFRFRKNGETRPLLQLETYLRNSKKTITRRRWCVIVSPRPAWQARALARHFGHFFHPPPFLACPPRTETSPKANLLHYYKL